MRSTAIVAVCFAVGCTTIVQRPHSDDDAGVGAPEACASAAARVRRVATTAELTAALAAAEPGDRIELADGIYDAGVVIDRSGRPDQPIALCGSPAAVLRGEDVASGYGVHLRADDWVLSGFAVTHAQKGVVVDGGERDVLWGLQVYDVGDEAIHLRAFSSDNRVERCSIRDTGRREPGFGEGVYLGSAESNWGEHSEGEPDRSDRNQVLDNQIGPGVTAEAIDLREGTTGGAVRGNRFDGEGMSGVNFADSWVDVKGNDYLIEGNSGSATLLDGFQSHVVVDGWGQRAAFHGNQMDGVPGLGISVDAASIGTVVGCDNEVSAGGDGLSNVECE